MSAAGLPPEMAMLAPGTELREGLDRIVNGHTGALIVLGSNAILSDISSGGFAIDVPFTATGMRELAKMDGAIVLSQDLTRILAAAVHLTPDASLETQETGTRHRTAERVGRQTGLPVVTVSASMRTISLFTGGARQVVPRPDELMERAGQAMAAIVGHRERLTRSLDRLTTLEVTDAVTLRAFAHVAQRVEMINRLADEVTGHIAAMGADGRLPGLQLRDLLDDLTPLSSLLERDYVAEGAETMPFSSLSLLADNELFDVVVVARSLGFPSAVHLDSPLRPRGFRQLSTIPRLASETAGLVVAALGSLPAIQGASVEELLAIDGVDRGQARALREGLGRITDRAISLS